MRDVNKEYREKLKKDIMDNFSKWELNKEMWEHDVHPTFFFRKGDFDVEVGNRRMRRGKRSATINGGSRTDEFFCIVEFAHLQDGPRWTGTGGTLKEALERCDSKAVQEMGKIAKIINEATSTGTLLLNIQEEDSEADQ